MRVTLMWLFEVIFLSLQLLNVKKIDGICPLKGEMQAAMLGLEEAYRRGIENIILERDSETVIKAIQCYPKRVEWRIHDEVGGMLQLFKHCRNWNVNHVPRDANSLAHHLARRAASNF